VTFKGDLFLMN